MQDNGTLILLAVVIVAFIAFQFYSSKRRKKQADERASAMVPGVEVMTTAGIYGTLVSMDLEENVAMVQIAPKVIIKLHSQAVRSAVPAPVADEPVEDAPADGPQLNTSNATPMAESESEPEFGERAKKPARKKPSSDTK